MKDDTLVRVTTAGYTATGWVQAVFEKQDGQIRLVVEYAQPAGLLHIHNLDQVEAAE